MEGTQELLMTLAQMKDKKAETLRRCTIELEKGGEKSPAYRNLLAEVEILTSDISSLEIVERSLPKAAAPVAAPSIVVVPESAEQRKHKVNQAARSFFKDGLNALNSEERALLTSNTTGVIPQSFNTTFTEAAKYFGPVWNLINRKDATTGEPTKWVVSDDTARTFSLLTEGTTSGSGVASQPTLFSNVTNTDTLISSVIYSVDELEDAFDLESFLTRQAGVAVSRAWETAITLATTNDGTATALPSSPAGGLLASLSAGVTQTSGTLAAGITYAQLNSLASSVDRAYYQTGSFMASPSVEAALRAVVDSTGRPLYVVDDEGYLVIAGKRLWPNSAMAASGTASSPLVLFGDYSKAWNVLNAGLRIKVVPDESAAISFLTREMLIWSRIGQGAGLSTAVKSLVSASS
jgi:HK97 family phage major capsid protein